MQFHPVSEIFPLMEGREFEALIADIKTNGLQEPIRTFKGQIIDGRNRFAACIAAGTEPIYKSWDGEDPLVFVLSENLHRRHLNESQRAMVAAKIANMPAHRPENNSANSQTSQAQAAEMLNVSTRTVAEAKSLKDKGVPALVAHVEQGKASVNIAKRISCHPEAVQEKACELIKQGEKPMNALRLAKREHIKENPVFPDGKYRIFYADPPWSYGDTRDGQSATGAADHYPSMNIEELCDFGEQVKAVSEENAVLFLWVTSPLLEECFPVIRAWGFKYKSSFVWDKIGDNMGHYNSVRHELLLVCTRGSCLPDIDTKIDSVQNIQKTRKHSEKPEEFRKIIETLYTHGNKIELFARSKHPGWEVFGNEV